MNRNVDMVALSQRECVFAHYYWQVCVCVCYPCTRLLKWVSFVFYFSRSLMVYDTKRGWRPINCVRAASARCGSDVYFFFLIYVILFICVLAGHQWCVRERVWRESFTNYSRRLLLLEFNLCFHLYLSVRWCDANYIMWLCEWPFCIICVRRHIYIYENLILCSLRYII